MSTEVLLRAASLMRERAEAVVMSEVAESRARRRAAAAILGDPSADHIAAWNPAAALAVADWLDFQAEVERRLGGPDYETPADHPALAVARAYLGEQP